MFGSVASVILSTIVIGVAYLYYIRYHLVLSPIVSIKDGKVQGVVSYSRDGRAFYEYRAIPFAKPPIGKLRFESPQPVKPWEGVLDATQYPNKCLQFDFIFLNIITGSSDCLYLSVSTPVLKSGNKKLLPVMIAIHGGYFHMGSFEDNGPKYFMDTDVVLVTISYRLGALGFLNTGDGVVRGNMGLKDQRLALFWIKENILAFQGNPDAVTLIGESAGGALAHYHVLSQKSKVFSRAIIQSGSVLSSWAMYRNVKEQSMRFAKKFNCPVNNSKAMVSCLKQLDDITLVSAHQELTDFFKDPIQIFAPSIEVIKDDDAFLTEEPLEILKNGRFNREVEVIFGCNSNEGLFLSAILGVNQTKLNQANDEWDTWAPKMMQYNLNETQVTSKLRKFYFGDKKTLINDTKHLQNFTDMIGDRMFTIPVLQSAELQSKFVQTYIYYLDYRAEFNLADVFASTNGRFHFVVNLILGRINALFHEHIMGQELPRLFTCHGDAVRLLFSGTWFEKILFSGHKDIQMSKDFVKLFADFVKDVTPLTFRNVEWPALTNHSVKYLRLGNDPAIIDNPFQIRKKFWESLNIPAN